MKILSRKVRRKKECEKMTCTNSSNCNTNGNPSNYQCDLNLYNPYQNNMDCRGVTYWAYPSTGPTYTLYPNDPNNTGKVEIKFTCTRPQCYHDERDVACLVLFDAYVSSYPQTEAGVNIGYKINGYDWGGAGCYITGTGARAQQAFDLVNGSGANFHYDGSGTMQNIFRITNTSTSSTVTVDNVRIIYWYQMCHPACTTCNNTDSCTQDGHICYSESSRDHSQDFAAYADYPCNTGQDAQNSRSCTMFQDPTFAGATISKLGGCRRWTFDFSEYSQYNYLNKESCIFNFNQVFPTGTSQYPSVRLDAYLNDSETPFATYYLSNQQPQGGGGIFPTFDLAILSGYNDTGTNSVTLKNNSLDVDVQMSNDGINIYRTYITRPVHTQKYLTLNAASEGSSVPSASTTPHSYDAGSSVSIAAFPNVGYHFVEWDRKITDSSDPMSYYSNQQFRNITMDNNYTLQPVFAQGCQSCNTCQTGCEISCQATCELECQDCQNCEIACMTECNVSCQTTCEITCQTGCEVGCQTGCEVACQTGCEVACQTGCEVSCQSGCEVGCETCQDCQYCEVMCMTPCDLCETN